MNFQQLEYIIAVDNHRQFSKAAEECNVTQATLSMMVKKLEDELDVKIFDRSKHPVIATETGKRIIARARLVLQEATHIRTLVREEKGEMEGDLKIGIIPTLAPFLLPLFINPFLQKYPDIKMLISELTTDEIVRQLEQHQLDVGILATPLHRSSMVEQPMFYEQFVVYASSAEKLGKKKYLLAEDIDVNRLWLLEEGHCLRSQIVNLCELKSKEKALHQLNFETGSLETLKKIVEAKQGLTILPQLALLDMSNKQKKNIRFFRSPEPVREISLVTYRHFIKKKLIDALKDEIISHIPKEMRTAKKRELVNI